MKQLYTPNIGKSIKRESDGYLFQRYPIKTKLFAKGDNFHRLFTRYTLEFFRNYRYRKTYMKSKNRRWLLVISEKSIAIAQGRSYLITDIKAGWWAKFLSRHVSRTPYGIGLGSEWTMQLAIGEIGLPRILLASAVAMVTKPFGLKGWFYRVAGREAACIDGPTEYSLYPSNVSAKLGPKDPQIVAESLRDAIEKKVLKSHLKRFDGVAIIDANDLGRNVLGNATNVSRKLIEQSFVDNPLGQGSEQTPMAVVFYEPL